MYKIYFYHTLKFSEYGYLLVLLLGKITFSCGHINPMPRMQFEYHPLHGRINQPLSRCVGNSAQPGPHQCNTTIKYHAFKHSCGGKWHMWDHKWINLLLIMPSQNVSFVYFHMEFLYSNYHCARRVWKKRISGAIVMIVQSYHQSFPGSVIGSRQEVETLSQKHCMRHAAKQYVLL